MESGKYFVRVASLAVLLILQSFSTGQLLAADSLFIPIRNHNPFLNVYGLPRFQSAVLTPQGRLDSGYSLDIANHSDRGTSASEHAVIDGESYFLDLTWRYGFTERLELALDIPIVSHQRGFLDGPVRRWHDLFGLSNGNRSGPKNRLLLSYDHSSPTGYLLDSPATGLGDIRLSGGWSLKQSRESALAIRASLKLPSGDYHRLTGSGAADVALGLYATDHALFSRNALSVTAFTGLLQLGDGKVLPELQRNTVGFVGVSTTWQFHQRLTLTGQLYGQGAYYDSDVDEIGGQSLQFAVSSSYRPAGSRVVYRLGLIEDIFSDATTDVAFHFSVRISGGASRSAR